MKRVFFLALLVATVLGLPQSADADTIKLTGVGNQSFNGYAAGPYTALLNNQPITMVCVSFDRHVTIGQQWTATVNTITEEGIANALYQNQADALNKYRQAAWLYAQMLTNPSNQGAIQGAIWNIFNSNLTPDTTNSNLWLGLAQQQLSVGFNGFDFSRFRILTPSVTGLNGPQENITMLPVPEPTSLLLLGSGMAAIATRLRRRRQREGNA
ncbi:MAG: PEP-CTERM sorting domain-containing protein [Pyrinomonadaceae bacterium]